WPGVGAGPGRPLRVGGGLPANSEGGEGPRSEAEWEAETRRAEGERVPPVGPGERELEVAGRVRLEHAVAVPASADHPDEHVAVPTVFGLGPLDRPGDHVVAVEADLVHARQQRGQWDRQAADREGRRPVPPPPGPKLPLRAAGGGAGRRGPPPPP